MKKARFLISTLAAAGFGAVHPLQDAMASTVGLKAGGDDPNDGKLFKVFKQDHNYILAGHRSHSSHSSHSSHRSSNGGGSTYPVYTPPAPMLAPTPAPDRETTTSRTPSLSGRTELFTSIVRRVQTGLMAYGYYDGPIDGVVGMKMKVSLSRFQSDYSLKVTGTITPEVLDTSGRSGYSGKGAKTLWTFAWQA